MLNKMSRWVMSSDKSQPFLKKNLASEAHVTAGRIGCQSYLLTSERGKRGSKLWGFRVAVLPVHCHHIYPIIDFIFNQPCETLVV